MPQPPSKKQPSCDSDNSASGQTEPVELAMKFDKEEETALSTTCDIEDLELISFPPQVTDDILAVVRAQQNAMPKSEAISGTEPQPEASQVTSEDVLAVREALELSKAVLSKVRVLGVSYNDLLSQTQRGSMRSEVLDRLCRPQTVQVLLRLCANSMSHVEDDMIELQQRLKRLTKDEHEESSTQQQASASLQKEDSSLKLKKVCFVEDAPVPLSQSVKNIASGLLSNENSGGLSEILSNSPSAREVLGRVPLFKRMLSRAGSRLSGKSEGTEGAQSAGSQATGEASAASDGLNKKKSKVSFLQSFSGLSGKDDTETEHSKRSDFTFLSQLSMETHHHDPLRDASEASNMLKSSRSVKTAIESNFTDFGEVTQLLTEAKLGVWGRLKHRVPFIQYFFFGVWVLVIFLVYRWQRFLCWHNLPDDCQMYEGWDQFMVDVQILFQSSMCLAVLTGMNQKAKFAYTFHFMRPRPRGWAFLLLLFVTAPVWSLLTKVPFLQDFSLRSGGVNGGYLVLTAFLIILVVFLVIWHIYVGYKYSEGCAFVAYIGSRLAVIAFYIVFMVSHANAASHGSGDFHLHHYFIGWICASFAEFSHPLSLMLLAIGTGVFVQGVAAYGADGFITESGGVRMTFEKLDGSSYYSPYISDEAAQFFTAECFGR